MSRVIIGFLHQRACSSKTKAYEANSARGTHGEDENCLRHFI